MNNRNPQITQPDEEATRQAFQSRSFIHYEGDRIDYAISDSELDELGRISDNLWKDFFLACTGVGLPCAINAISIYSSIKVASSVSSKAASSTASAVAAPFIPTAPFVLNALVGLVGIVLGIAFGIAWYRSTKSSDAIIHKIKTKPRVEIPTEN